MKIFNVSHNWSEYSIDLILAHCAGIICLSISYALNYAGIFDGGIVVYNYW